MILEENKNDSAMDIESKTPNQKKKLRRKDKKMSEITFKPAGLSNPKI